MKTWLLAAMMMLTTGTAYGGTVGVVIDGERKGVFEEYRVGDEAYLGAQDVGKIYGAQVYWYPVSGRLRLSLRGKRLDLMVGSSRGTLDGREVELGSPVILRGSHAFLPVRFIVSEAFVGWTGMRSEIDGPQGTLSVGKTCTIGPMRWATHGDYTRLVLELEAEQAYKIASRGLAGLEVSLPLGSICSEKHGTIGDTRVAGFMLSQEARQARLSVRLSGPTMVWKSMELGSPRRLVLDVFHRDDEEPPTAVEERPSPPVSRRAAVASPSSILERDAPVPPQKGRPLRIVVDPGHGGKDSGAVGVSRTLEKNVAMTVARGLARKLRQDSRFESMLTRTADYFVPLSERARLANEFQADLFISIHCNASREKGDAGFEVFFLSEKASDPDAERLAEFENSVLALEGESGVEDKAAMILWAMTKTEHINDAAQFATFLSRRVSEGLDIKNRGVKQANFYVLRGTNAPSVLVETAFLSNRKDAGKLAAKSFRRDLVERLYRAVEEYAEAKQKVGSL